MKRLLEEGGQKTHFWKKVPEKNLSAPKETPGKKGPRQPKKKNNFLPDRGEKKSTKRRGGTLTRKGH